MQISMLEFLYNLPPLKAAAYGAELAKNKLDGIEYVVRLSAYDQLEEQSNHSMGEPCHVPLAGISTQALASIAQHSPRRAPRKLARDALIRLGRLQGAAGRMGGLSHPILISSAVPFLDGVLIVSEMGYPFVPATDYFVIVAMDWVPDANMSSREREVAAIWSGLLSRPKLPLAAAWGWDALETQPEVLRYGYG